MKEKRSGLRTEANNIHDRENFIDFSIVADNDIDLVEFLITQIKRFGRLRHNLVILLSQDEKFDYILYEKSLTMPLIACARKETGKWLLKTSISLQACGYPPEIRQE